MADLSANSNFQSVNLGQSAQPQYGNSAPAPSPAPASSAGNKLKNLTGFGSHPVVDLGLRVAGICMGMALLFVGFFAFGTGMEYTFARPILSWWVLVSALLMIFTELRYQNVFDCLEFLGHFLGRGLFYIFVGTLALGCDIPGIVFGIFTMLLGILNMFAAPTIAWPRPAGAHSVDVRSGATATAPTMGLDDFTDKKQAAIPDTFVPPEGLSSSYSNQKYPSTSFYSSTNPGGPSI